MSKALARHFRAGTRSRSILQGKLFGEAGATLTPTHAVKSGRRYRYYVSRDSSPSTDANAADGQLPRWRLPAREIERFVEEAGLLEKSGEFKGTGGEIYRAP